MFIFRIRDTIASNVNPKIARVTLYCFMIFFTVLLQIPHGNLTPLLGLALLLSTILIVWSNENDIFMFSEIGYCPKSKINRDKIAQ